MERKVQAIIFCGSLATKNQVTYSWAVTQLDLQAQAVASIKIRIYGCNLHLIPRH